jgi:hypothetical protein
MTHTAWTMVTAGAVCLATALAGAATALGPAVAEPLNRCAPTENGDPVLDSLTMGPQVVDARLASQQVVVTAQAHDTGGPGPRTGVRSIELFLTNGRSFQMRYTGGHTWTATATVPRWSKSGRLAVDSAFVTDRADFPDRTPADDDGLYDVVYQSDEGHTWAEVAGDRDVEVLSDRDDTLPRITDVDLYPPTVDTRATAKYVYVTTRAFDGVSGVRDGRVDLYPRAAGPIGPLSVHMRPLPGRHGLMRGRFLVPTRAGNEPWDIQGVTVRDNAGRRRTLTVGDLAAAGYPTRLGVTSGPLPPAGRAVLRSITVSPGQLDVRTGDASVTYRVRATNGPGLVQSVGFSFPFAAGIRGEPRARLVSGDRHDGVWSATVVVDGCRSQGGVLTPYVTAYDWASNDQREGPSIPVLAGDNTDPRAQGLSVVDGDVVVPFSEDVNGISAASMRLTYRVGGAPVAGSWTCSTAGGDPTDCLTGAARSARFAPDVALPNGQEYALVVNPEGNLGVTDLAGNPVPRQRVA